MPQIVPGDDRHDGRTGIRGLVAIAVAVLSIALLTAAYFNPALLALP